MKQQSFPRSYIRSRASCLRRACGGVWGEVIASHVTTTVAGISTKLFCDQTPNYFVIKHQIIS